MRRPYGSGMKRIVADTNVLVRLVVRDDVEQWEIASKLFRQHGFVLLTTVVLETEWVLRSRYRLDAMRVCALFEDMMNLDAVEFQEPERVRQALAAHRLGMDFADALHMVATPGGHAFVTFDESLVRQARQQFDHVAVELAQ